MSGIVNTLKPCPICGGEPEFQHFNIMPNVRGRIICSCGLEIRQGANDTEDDLRIIWNTRADENTRWNELFGTPERAARTLHGFCEDCFCGDCSTCGLPDWADYRHDYDALLEWLEGENE